MTIQLSCGHSVPRAVSFCPYCPDASLQALQAAEGFVKDIKFFRSHGSGDMSANYADHRSGDGYSWIVLRARKMTRMLPAFAKGGPRDPDAYDLIRELVAGIEDMRSRDVINEEDDSEWLDATIKQARDLLLPLGVA